MLTNDEMFICYTWTSYHHVVIKVLKFCYDGDRVISIFGAFTCCFVLIAVTCCFDGGHVLSWCVDAVYSLFWACALQKGLPPFTKKLWPSRLVLHN